MSVIAEPKQTRADAQVVQTRLPWWRQSRWSLALMFLVLVIVPIVIIAYITLTQVRQTTEDQVISQLESVAELKAQAIDRWIVTSQESLELILASNTTLNYFGIIVEQPDVGFAYGELNVLLADAQSSHEGVAEYFFYDVDEGTVLIASDPDRVGQSVRRKPYFTSSLVQSYVQFPYYEITGDLVMVATTPVIDDGEVIGVLAARLNLDTLSGIMLESAGMGETGETYLISAQSNFLLTESRFEGFSQNRAYQSYGINRALEGISGSGLYDDYRGVPILGVYRWVDALQAALLAEIDEDEALQDYNDAQNIILILTIALAAAAVGIGVFVATRFSNPIEALTQTASQLASGDLAVRAQTRQRNEIGVLSGVFNDMAEQLQTTVGTLESRVEARTRDLFLTLEVGQLATRIYQQEDLLPLITEYVRQQFGLYYTQVYLIDDADRYAVLSSGTGEVGAQLMERGHRLNLRETSIVARTVQTQRPVLVANTELSDIHMPNPLLPETRSEVAIPLIVGDEVIGVLDMQATKAETFREDNLPVFEAMASQLASALRSAQAYAETQAAVEQSNAVSRRLTAQTWESYLGRVASGERVGYRYDLQNVEPLAADMEADGGDQPGMLTREVKLRDQVIGQLALGEDAEREWTAEEMALVDGIAERVAAALDQFRAFDDTRDALDRVDLIMGSAGEGIYGLDRNGNMTFVNAAASAMDGFDVGELIGQHHHTLMHHTRRDGTPYPEEKCPIHATLQDGRSRTSDDELFWRKDGTSFPVELTANAIVQEGDVVGAVVTFRDITERLEAQAERDRLFEETRRRASEMETVAQVGTEAAATLEIENLLWHVSDLTKERFDLYHAHIYLLDDTGEHLMLRAGAGQPGRHMVDAGHHIPFNHERSLVARAARTGEAVLVENVTTAADFLPNPLLLETRSEMAIPL
ncbi:MAG: GAF domain-containing protein, partial [Anaerolineae bacterium]|nr:GAF domain-containing protein [Anaerolineae bacterium]